MSGGVARVARARIDGRWHADAVVAVDDDGLRLATGPARSPGELPLHELTLLPPITDAHVHLGLAEPAAETRIGRVLDLGWDPAGLPALIAAAPSTLDVRFAGAFLTAPGGYPSDRDWAPTGAAVELADPTAASAAVRAQAAAGAAVVKVALNADAGPVPPDAVLAAIVAAAHELRLRVVAHAQGEGQPERALAAGVDALAHTPWTHRLPDAAVAEAAARTIWISTLAMHGRDGDDLAFARATDNLARFAAAGGAVACGTDLGNGSSRLDLDDLEVAALRQAGIEGPALVDALIAAPLLGGGPVVSAFPPDVADDRDVLASLHRSRPMRLTDMEDA